jgi:hypothetical protein
VGTRPPFPFEILQTPGFTGTSKRPNVVRCKKDASYNIEASLFPPQGGAGKYNLRTRPATPSACQSAWHAVSSSLGPAIGNMLMTKHPPAASAAVALQIEVVGADLTGQQFVERTRTLTITRDGATILLAINLAPESEVIVRNLLTNEEALARVVGHIKEDAAGHIYGIAFVDSSVDLWRVQFGEAQSGEHTLLECSGCQSVQAASLTGIEMEIFESKGALTRHCETCKTSTIWKRTARSVPDEQEAITPRKSPGPEMAAPTGKERRRERRTAMKPAACIRWSGREEVVVCEDMSRGGFRFKGRKQYPEGTRIEAAVPYVPSNVNIFVSARIVYHQKLSDGSYRHGVTYLKFNE